MLGQIHHVFYDNSVQNYFKVEFTIIEFIENDETACEKMVYKEIYSTESVNEDVWSQEAIILQILSFLV